MAQHVKEVDDDQGDDHRVVDDLPERAQGIGTGQNELASVLGSHFATLNRP